MKTRMNKSKKKNLLKILIVLLILVCAISFLEVRYNLFSFVFSGNRSVNVLARKPVVLGESLSSEEYREALDENDTAIAILIHERLGLNRDQYQLSEKPVMPVKIGRFRNVIDFRICAGMFPVWADGEIVAFIDLYKTDNPLQKINIEKLSDLMKSRLNQTMHDHPEGIILVRDSRTFLHMVLPDNTVDAMGSSMVDVFRQGADYYQLFNNEWSKLKI